MSTVEPPRGRAITPLAVWNAVKTPLTLLALLALLYFGVRAGWRAFSAPIPQPPPPACTTALMPELTSDKVVVNVYNGSTERGRARAVGTNLKSVGFKVQKTANTDERITSTIIRGASADNPEVKLVAGFFKNAKVEADGRVTGTVDVMVGARNPGEEADDWAGMNHEAPTKLALPSVGACLPQTSAPPSPSGPPSGLPTAQPS